VSVEDVTPDQARRWIRRSHQRNTDLMKCRAMLDDVEGGRWDPARQEGKPVIVGAGGTVVADGHHRLVTILMHGKPLPCEVEYRD
jgi:hypothetical protein